MENLTEFEYAKEKYKMTEQECEQMYKEISKFIFENCVPNPKNPIAVITGGQPGSGKSSVVIKSKRDFAQTNENAAVLDVDTYRGLFKNSALLAKEFPQYYSEITDPIVGKVMDKLVNETIRNGYNFIFEGTLGNTVIIDKIEKSDVNYKTIARLMAVSRYESMFSVFERYIEMNKKMGMGRLTTIEAHDIRYNNFNKIAQTLEKRGIEVEVYTRSEDFANPTMIYKTSEEKKQYGSVMEALIAGREDSYKKWKQTAEQRIEAINKDIKESNVDEEINEELNKLNNIYKKEKDREISGVEL